MRRSVFRRTFRKLENTSRSVLSVVPLKWISLAYYSAVSLTPFVLYFRALAAITHTYKSSSRLDVYKPLEKRCRTITGLRLSWPVYLDYDILLEGLVSAEDVRLTFLKW